MTEIAEIYKGNADGIVKWVRAPGKKRADMMQMPPFSEKQIGNENLKAVADYILQTGAK